MSDLTREDVNMGELTIRVKTIIGTGDALDRILLIPLISDWHVPRNCAGALWIGKECKSPLARLYVLAEPIQGHSVVGVCEKHHRELDDGSHGETPCLMRVDGTYCNHWWDGPEDTSDE